MNKPAMTIDQAITQLAISPRGRKALHYLFALLKDGGRDLDLANLSALEALIANCAHRTAANVMDALEVEIADHHGIAEVECALLAPTKARSIAVRTVPVR